MAGAGVLTTTLLLLYATEYSTVSTFFSDVYRVRKVLTGRRVLASPCTTPILINRNANKLRAQVSARHNNS